jgi:HTH-type transcriptional regulator, sugar sensing transcriptional regulator
MDELTRELTHLGLTEKEAAVYLAAMELGPSVAQDIAKKAKVNRASTYVMIDSLKTRGLVSSYSKGKKKYFAAESPDRLQSMIRLQRQELEGKEAEFNNILPQLLALYNVEGTKPQVRFLEGLEGIKTIQQEMAQLEGEVIQIFPMDDVHDFIGRVMDESHKKVQADVKRAHVPVRALAVVKNEEVLKDLPEPINTEIRVIPEKDFPIHGEVSVREDRVILFSYKSSLVAIVITSQVLADTIRALFDLAWVGAEKYPLHKHKK